MIQEVLPLIFRYGFSFGFGRSDGIRLLSGGEIVDSVAYVAGVSVKPQQRGFALSRNEPPVELDAVRRRKAHVPVLQARNSRCERDVSLWEEYELPVQQRRLPRENPSYHDHQQQKGRASGNPR